MFDWENWDDALLEDAGNTGRTYRSSCSPVHLRRAEQMLLAILGSGLGLFEESVVMPISMLSLHVFGREDAHAFYKEAGGDGEMPNPDEQAGWVVRHLFALTDADDANSVGIDMSKRLTPLVDDGQLELLNMAWCALRGYADWNWGPYSKWARLSNAVDPIGWVEYALVDAAEASDAKPVIEDIDDFVEHSCDTLGIEPSILDCPFKGRVVAMTCVMQTLLAHGYGEDT